VAGSALILGGGVTGLATGIASGFPVYEAADVPGGICASYYVRPGRAERLSAPPDDGEAYRFEIGGGHWIFGGAPDVLTFIDTLAPGRRYVRHSSVYFAQDELYVPYPLQNNLRYLKDGIAPRALAEMSSRTKSDWRTMADWLESSFGKTLFDLFFYPFNVRYTDGLVDRVAPQDAYKSPVQLSLAIRGAFQGTSAVGYNVSYFYPTDGLSALAQRMAARCTVVYGRRVVEIRPDQKRVVFADGSEEGYERLVSTLPLNRAMELSGLTVDTPEDPYTSVLVSNIGATKGARCPADHWLYIPDSRAAFHRVGFYSNVDPLFLPASSRDAADRVSIYVERAYQGSGQRPSAAEIAAYEQAVVQELRDWEFIRDAEVVDSTWIDVAYTWSWPGSRWVEKAMETLRRHDIHQIGRYGKWTFQGIADSIGDGFMSGAAFRAASQPR